MNRQKILNPRLAAAETINSVLSQGRSLSDALEQQLPAVGERNRALAQALAYGVLRHLPQLEAIAESLLRKPFRSKDSIVYALLLTGLYQLLHMRVPDHAAVAETVSACKSLKRPWAVGVLNGVMRGFLRDRDNWQQRLQTPELKLAHPEWLVKQLRQAWGDEADEVMQNANRQAPMWLRVDIGNQSRDDYLKTLQDAGMTANSGPHSAAAICLEKATGVENLPGFEEGACSVQDAAAQLAAELLAPQNGDRILDACAAPGGKTGHLLEYCPEPELLIALDKDGARVGRIQENLERLGRSAELVDEDAAEPEKWWDGTPFDRILLDVPCSATGVIRRHPDIKWLRQEDDIKALQQEQARILKAIWPLLKPGGRLVYATCSILPVENSEQIDHFLKTHDDAREETIDADWGRACQHGRQILPGEDDMDGFYYACLSKSTD